MTLHRAQQLLCFCSVLLLGMSPAAAADPAPSTGLASWYGEDHRGKPMANGLKFDPDKPTAASWFYPLGTKVRVTAYPGSTCERSVLVTITDRGPAKRLVRDGRIIDLTHSAFKELTYPEAGLVDVRVEPVPEPQYASTTASTTR